MGGRAPLRIAEVRAKPERLVAGLMTGTSMDGLDIAVCRVAAGVPRRCDLVTETSEPFPADLREALLAGGALSAADAARLSRRLGEWYADAVERLTARNRLALDLVGVHGQTVYHEHGVTTLQLGEPAFLAERLGCPVVADFRVNDIAAGGCGAPLVSIFDIWLLSDPQIGVVALNLGGISNITAMLPRPDADPLVLGFDCGPANMVLDMLAVTLTGGAQGFDIDGRLAARGRVREEWIEEALRHPFFAAAPPKSAGREQFGAPYAEALLERARPRSDQDGFDLMASAVELTVRPIADALARFVSPLGSVGRLVVAGGGTRNPVVMQRLTELVQPAEVVTTDALGIPSHLKEAIAFALLASARIDEIPANVPSVTGARRPVLLGKIVEV